MRKLFTFYALFFICTLGYGQLTVEKIMTDPAKWMGTSPSGVFWSDDSKTVYFNWNPEQNLADSLYKITLENRTPQKVSWSEQQNLNTGGGFFGRAEVFSKDFSKKLYLKDGNIFIKEGLKEKQLTNTLDRKGSPTFNLDESQVVFSQGSNLFTIDLASGTINQITNFSSSSKRPESRLNGADKALEKDQMELFEVFREAKEKKDAREKYNKLTEKKKLKEISTEGKMFQGAVASPDLKYVVYRLMEPAKGAKRTIVPAYVTESGYTEDIPGRTKVGQPESSTENYIFDIEKDTVIKIITKNIPGIREMPKYLNDYPKDSTSAKKPSDRGVSIGNPIWSPDGKHAVVVVMSDDNKDRWIMKLEMSKGTLSLIDRQRDEAWIGGPGIGGRWGGSGLGFIDNNTLYYQSEATGYSHLYTVNLSTNAKKQLTAGKYEIKSADLSKDKKWFYMTTNEVHPGETHFYKMAVTGGERIKITQMEGGNEVSLSPDEKTIAFRYSNTNTPWELYLQANDASAKAEKATSSLTDEFKAYNWMKPKVTSFIARDGQEIFTRIYEPTKKKKNGKAVVFVHGAGYLQNAHKWWSQYFREYMFHNLLVEKGYTVMDMDYRASSGYGRDVRTGIYRFMGGKDLTDNVDGAKLLVDKYGVNPKKIGVYGGSYGGFITLMAMFTTPDVFSAGAALRPVTDWAAYNQGYTANILNEPQADSIAYRRSSPIFHAEGLKGKLLICHGMVDVNVHAQDSYRLVQRLIELRKENWEMASYPMEDHGFVHPTSWMDEYKRILKLFEEM